MIELTEKQKNILRSMFGSPGAKPLEWTVDTFQEMEYLASLNLITISSNPDGVPFYHIALEGANLLKEKDASNV